MKANTTLFLMLSLLCTAFTLHAQPGNTGALDIAYTYINEHLDVWGLTPQDIEGMTINDMYTDKTSGITRIYFLQRYQGIPVYNAILNVSITKAGEVFFAGNRFVQDLQHKVNATAPAINSHDAVLCLAAHLGVPRRELQLKKQDSAGQFVFEKSSIAREDISVKLSYQPDEGKVFLAWDILFAPIGNADKWNSRIDAVTGDVLDEYNWTVYCGKRGEGSAGQVDAFNSDPDTTSIQIRTISSGVQYNVWPAPIESPNHGPRTIVTDPHDPIASPFGWHDIDGQPGADFTVTRGNNVYAYQDRYNTGYSSNDEPNGGPQLHFDFPFNPSWEPKQYTDASVVNFFYWVNYMHDFAYRFGFDEPAGNFQKNNYGNGGLGNDQIFAIAQVGAEVGLYDYPYYSHGNEGTRGVIFMEEYNRGRKGLSVLAPAVIAGIYPSAVPAAGWGPNAYIPVTGQVVLMEDNVGDPLLTDGCDELTNAAELTGKIAMVDRVGCDMGGKVIKAQEAGAIGAIICNYDDEFLTWMDPGIYGTQLNIPVVIITASDCSSLHQFINDGVIVRLEDGLEGPAAHDLGLDNGFIAHEYGHGISWRLAGGPNAACFDNKEQMDEGWSDFFALAVTVRPGDTGTTKRSIGTYVADQLPGGLGNRRYQYSTDMEISPLTYGDVAYSHERHDVGEVWGNVLWDMYWALVELYGWNPDPLEASSGNHMAIRLAFEGLKNLPCSPGFVDGRNAMLAADQALYGGAHQCMLWEIFARRGLGYSADQGSPFDAGDQTEAFDLPPLCTKSILLTKTVTDFIEAGEDIEVKIKVGNYKDEAATGVVVTDEIPAGTAYKANSANVPANVQGDVISFAVGNLSVGQEKTITYMLTSSPYAWSLRKFLDDVPEASNNQWLTHSDCGDQWSITDEYPARSGEYCWRAKEVAGLCTQALELDPDIYTFHVDGDHPVLRFYHRYETRAAINGGVVEIKELGMPFWMHVDDQIVRHAYPTLISYNTFQNLNLHAFSGVSGDNFEASYVDLSPWKSKDIQIRFRLGTISSTPMGTGWFIDDIEFMNMLSYNGEACVTTNEGDVLCTIAPYEGTIVDSRENVSGTTDTQNRLEAKIYPNPATDKITIACVNDQEQLVRVSLMTMDGRVLYEESLVFAGSEQIHINTTNVPAGMYMVSVNTAEGQLVEKVIIHE